MTATRAQWEALAAGTGNAPAGGDVVSFSYKGTGVWKLNGLTGSTSNGSFTLPAATATFQTMSCRLTTPLAAGTVASLTFQNTGAAASTLFVDDLRLTTGGTGGGTTTTTTVAGTTTTTAGTTTTLAGSTVPVLRWSYSTIRGTLLAVADDVGTKIGATYRWDPDGMPLTGTTQPDLQPAAWERGWLGTHNRMTDTTDTTFPIIDMGARPYTPTIGRFLSVDPVEDGVGPSDYLYPTDPVNGVDLNGTVRSCVCAGGGGGGIPAPKFKFPNPFRRSKSSKPPSNATKPGTAIARACKTANSFAYDTEVLMADGTRRAISDLKVGDRVLATDPETGLTAGREVTAVHLNLDLALANVTVIDSDGDVSTINTTQHHPFWNVSDTKWTDVIDLDSGDRLRSTDGSLLTVVSVRSFTGEQWMWDLTVDEIHTFYVSSGDDPILVHNCVEGSDLDLLVKRGGKTTTDFEDVANRLATNSGVSREVASKRLHTIKGGVENNRDVVFTRSGGVYDAISGDYLGSLTGG